MSGGRPPKGPRLIEGHEGSEEAKRRLQVILETIAGEHSVKEACAILGIGETAFHELRARAIAGALSTLEPGARGRPRRGETEETPRIRALEQENQDLKIDLRAAQIREEIALVMPHLLKKKSMPRAGPRGGGGDDGIEAAAGEEAAKEETPLARRSAHHVKRLQAIWDIKAMDGKGQKKRGYPAQQDRRKLERSVRIGALIFRRWTAQFDLPRTQAAEKLCISPETIRKWEQGWRKHRLHPKGRGRPAERPEVTERNEIIALFNLMGPGVGLPTLRATFPHVPVRELEHLKTRYRNTYRKKNTLLIQALRWEYPGAVWAMDYTQPPRPIDGIYPYLLVVRDLASGCQIWNQPLKNENAANTVALLKALFLWYGPPLVIKMDNGSPLVGEAVLGLLRTWNVFPLLSPPYTPEYNGACEAGIGAIKLRAHLESARHDRPGQWTCDDLEAARLMANETSRPRGYLSPTPQEAWERREPVNPALRDAFISAYVDFESKARADLGYLPGLDLSPRQQAAVDRIAISRALVAYGFLFFRRRRITPPFKARRPRRIS